MIEGFGAAKDKATFQTIFTWINKNKNIPRDKKTAVAAGITIVHASVTDYHTTRDVIDL